VRPMYQATQVIPFVHASNPHAVAQAQGHAFREVQIVRDQQGPAITDVENKTLMARAIVVVR